MTAAERQRRHRAAKTRAPVRDSRHVTKLTGAEAADKITALEREVIGLKFKLTEARDRAADGGPSDEVLRLRHENASLRRQLALARATTKPKRPTGDPSEQVDDLRARIRELQKRLREVAESPRGTVFIATADRRKILACLHPDHPDRTARALTEAFQIFTTLPIREV